MLSIAQPFIEDLPLASKRSRVEVQSALNFSNEDKVGTLQPYDDALVVTFRIRGYDVKRVLVDQGSGVENIYLELFKGLKLMPFELKNVGSTYQRMMTRMFESQLGKNIEVYIDYMVVKSKVESEHIGDLGNIFEILRKHKLCLNATKCSFGVGSGKFLDYKVTHHGIEIDPDQIRAINDL